MLAMQYSFTLPRDYDMRIVRDRVARRGPSFDQTEHLVFKAFLIAEAGGGRGDENRYAPFYLWQSEQGTMDFLSSPGFVNLTGSFGWPDVRLWMPFVFGRGETTGVVKAATRQIVRIAPHSDLAALRQAELVAHAEALSSPYVHTRVVALDPHAWEIVRFTLWTQDVSQNDYDPADTVRYEVLHLSAPGLSDPGTRR